MTLGGKASVVLGHDNDSGGAAAASGIVEKAVATAAALAVADDLDVDNEAAAMV